MPHACPPLFVAWRAEAATDSGDVHREMRERFKAGDTEVVDTMRAIAGLRERAEPLLTGDTGGLGILWSETSNSAAPSTTWTRATSRWRTRRRGSAQRSTTPARAERSSASCETRSSSANYGKR